MRKKILMIGAIFITLCIVAGTITAANLYSQKNEATQISKKQKVDSAKQTEAPIVVIPTSQDKQIKGSASKSAAIFVEINNKKVAKGKTDDKGKFAIQIPEQKKDTQIKVYTKKADQQSLNTVVTVK